MAGIRRPRVVVESPRVEALPVLWTGDRQRDRMLADAGFCVDDLRRILAVNREALEATLPEKRVHKVHVDRDGVEHEYVERTEGGAPDWDARLRASEIVGGWAGLKGQQLKRVAIFAPITIRWQGARPTSTSSPTSPGGSNGISTNGHKGSGRVSWSRTDDSAKP